MASLLACGALPGSFGEAPFQFPTELRITEIVSKTGATSTFNDL